MVSFICDTCQDTVKKPKVPQHMQRCRGCWSLSCIDCGVSFDKQSIGSHTSCVTEEEKYHKSVYQPKGGKKRKAEENDAPEFAKKDNAPSNVPSEPTVPVVDSSNVEKERKEKKTKTEKKKTADSGKTFDIKLPIADGKPLSLEKYVKQLGKVLRKDRKMPKSEAKDFVGEHLQVSVNQSGEAILTWSE
jgi:cell growth-regulating nucleolar protein